MNAVVPSMLLLGVVPLTVAADGDQPTVKITTKKPDETVRTDKVTLAMKSRHRPGRHRAPGGLAEGRDHVAEGFFEGNPTAVMVGWIDFYQN